MKKKLMVILICILLISISVLPVIGKTNVEKIDITKYYSHSEKVILDNLPVWEIGDYWIYEIDDIDIEHEKDGISLNIDIKIDDFIIEVVDDTVDSYILDYQTKINGGFTIAFDQGDGPIEINFQFGRILSTKIKGDMKCSKSDLGIEELNIEFSSILRVKITEQPYIGIPIPTVLIPITIKLDSGLSTPFAILDFPINIENYWLNPTTNFTLEGGLLRSPWLRPINFINNIMRFLGIMPAQYVEISNIISEILPIIYINKVLDLFEVSGSINIPTILGFICESYEEIVTLSGTYESYKILFFGADIILGNIYYSPNVGKIIKIILDGEIISILIASYILNGILVEVPDIEIELKDTNYS